MAIRNGAFLLFAFLAAGLVCAGGLAAQQAKMPASKEIVRLTLEGGERIGGTIVLETKSAVRIQTPLGTRSVAPEAIILRDDPADARTAYARRAHLLREDDVPAREALAAWCRAEGLTAEYAAEVGRVMALEPGREKVAEWSRADLGRYEIVRNTQPAGKPRWTREQSDLLFAALDEAPLARAAIIRAELERMPEDVWLGDAVKSVKSAAPARRWAAAALLGGTKDVRRVKPLYLRALTDPKAFVRREAVRSLAVGADRSLARPFISALEKNDNAAVRIFAAEALGEIRDAASVEPLVRAMEDAGARRLAHQNVSFLTQTTYVKDFDVEVAQNAFIADPIVDILQEGIVLDAALISVNMERRVIGRALARIVGKRLGEDPRAWREHLKTAARE